MVMPCDPQEPRLPKPLERFQIDSQLSQDAKEQRRANRAAAMDRNRGSSAVLVAPPLVTAGLACSLDPKSCGKALELGGAGTSPLFSQTYRLRARLAPGGGGPGRF